jgi:hypothetical protein
MITGRADPICPHQRRIQAGDIGLNDPVRDSRCEQVQGGAAVRRSIAGLVCRQRHSSA